MSEACKFTTRRLEPSWRPQPAQRGSEREHSDPVSHHHPVDRRQRVKTAYLDKSINVCADNQAGDLAARGGVLLPGIEALIIAVLHDALPLRVPFDGAQGSRALFWAISRLRHRSWRPLEELEGADRSQSVNCRKEK